MKYCSYLILIFLLSSCSAFMYNTKPVLTEIVTKSEARVYINGSYQEDHEFGTYGLEKHGVYNIDIECPGYKTNHKVLYKSRFNNNTFISLVGLYYGVALELFSNRHWYFPTRINVNDLIKLPINTIEDDQFFFSDLTWSKDIDFMKMAKYKGVPRLGGKKIKSKTSADFTLYNSYDLDKTVDDLNFFFQKMDEDKSSGRIYHNGLKVNVSGEVLSANIHYVKAREAKEDWYRLEMKTKYVAISPLGDTIFNKVINVFSDEFLVRTPMSYVVLDGLQLGTIKVLNSAKEIGYQRLDSSVFEKELPSYWEIESKPERKATADDLLKVKLTDGDFGVAAPISMDGNIIMAHETFENREGDFLYTEKKDSLEYQLVKSIQALDIVIVKVNKSFSAYFPRCTNRDINHLDDYNVLGFEDDESSLISSFVKPSSIRNTGEINLLQFDQSFSYLNSPIVISKDGELIGFICKDVQSYRYSGISFVIPLFQLDKLIGEF